MNSDAPMTQPDIQPKTPKTAAPLRRRDRAVTWAIVVALIYGLFFVDFFTTWFWYQPAGLDWAVGLLVGLCIGQVTLIALWASLAPGNVVLRSAWSVALVLIMWYGLILGVPSMLFRNITRSDALVLLAVVASGAIILQVPLWIAKAFFRWRLIHRRTTAIDSTQDDRQFRLEHLLMATALVALALAPFREVLPPAGNERVSINDSFVILLSVLIACNLVITIPCIWWAFAKTSRVIVLTAVWPFYCAGITAIEFACLHALLGPPGVKLWQRAMTFFVANLAQCAVVVGALLIFRAIGFRLVRTPQTTNSGG